MSSLSSWIMIINHSDYPSSNIVFNIYLIFSCVRESFNHPPLQPSFVFSKAFVRNWPRMSSHRSSKAENGRDIFRSHMAVPVSGVRKVRTFVICPMNPMNHKNMSKAYIILPATVETPTLVVWMDKTWTTSDSWGAAMFSSLWLCNCTRPDACRQSNPAYLEGWGKIHCTCRISNHFSTSLRHLPKLYVVETKLPIRL